MASREKIRSVIVTEDSEFRMKSVSMLNNIAFAAEKVVCASCHEAVKIIEGDPLVGNIVFDATSTASATALKANAAIKNLLTTRRDLFALVYVAAGQKSSLEGSELSHMRHVMLAPMMIDRKHFMEIFYTRRAASSTKAATPKIDETLKLAAQDAAQHLKDAVEWINGLAADHKRLDLLALVGQRFNGLMGTFQFFAGTAAARDLAEIGTFIDAITRTYEKSPVKEITPEHFELLVTAFKCTLPLIRMLALGDPVKDETSRQLAWARTVFQRDKLLKKREGLKQQNVDNVLAKRDENAAEMKKACVEASTHIKSTIEHLNVVFKDHKRLDALEAVGQRFNGFFGTFSFYRQHLGSDDLIDLGSLIDDLCRTYREPGAPAEVAEDHVKLLRDSAETCLYLLKDLREGREPQGEQKSRIGTLVAAAQKDPRIHRRRSVSQTDIDALLDELTAA